jgi:pimeloyl-ACP methyl ester carboxylesterase
MNKTSLLVCVALIILLAPAARATPTAGVDLRDYPFPSHFYETEEGRLHYIDEGEGRTIVFVHGTPTWSYLYRHLIADLSADYRCIAVDHLGFGLSDKPADADLRPEAHAQRLANLLHALNITDATLVVHDFGGPIGLHWAQEHPERIGSLVLFNTWMWSLDYRKDIQRMSRLIDSWFGRMLYLRFNFSARYLVPYAWGPAAPLSKEIHAAYEAPFPHRDQRHGPWQMGRALRNSDPWFRKMWERRNEIAGIPVLLIWGEADRSFGIEELTRWQDFFPDAELVLLPRVGHFPQEEAPKQVGAAMRSFLRATW